MVVQYCEWTYLTLNHTLKVVSIITYISSQNNLYFIKASIITDDP